MPPATAPKWTRRSRIAGAVLRNWEEIKAAGERRRRRRGKGISHSRLDTVQRAMPALAEAAKIGVEGGEVRIRLAHWRDLLPKLAEEIAELEAEAARRKIRTIRQPTRR